MKTIKSSNYARIMATIALIALPMTSYGADGTGTSTATIVAPITITPVLALAFGKFSANTGGTVIVNATTAARSVASGTAVLVSQGSTTTAATFDIGGDGTAGFSITLPATPINITHTNTVNTMSVGTFTSNPATSSALVAGAKTISVGATLTIASAQLAGAYSGTFTVTVEYN